MLVLVVCAYSPYHELRVRRPFESGHMNFVFALLPLTFVMWCDLVSQEWMISQSWNEIAVEIYVIEQLGPDNLKNRALQRSGKKPRRCERVHLPDSVARQHLHITPTCRSAISNIPLLSCLYCVCVRLANIVYDKIKASLYEA